jgi:hypothetical protein
MGVASLVFRSDRGGSGTAPSLRSVIFALPMVWESPTIAGTVIRSPSKTTPYRSAKMGVR